MGLRVSQIGVSLPAFVYKNKNYLEIIRVTKSQILMQQHRKILL